MKKVLALVTALVLTLAMAVGASASVPDKPSEFAYAYDFDGSVLSNSTKTTIEQYGAALEEATGIQTIAVVVDFLDGEDPADYATDIINSWGVGQSGENNGVVIGSLATMTSGISSHRRARPEKTLSSSPAFLAYTAREICGAGKSMLSY